MKYFSENNNHPGSLGIAISEAIELAVTSSNVKYSLGSVLDAVLLHQTVIGQETIAQMEEAGVFPDTVIGCVGGGSNFAGIAFPFMRTVIKENKKIKFIAGTKMNVNYIPQDGRFAFQAVNRHGETKQVDVRINFMPGI